MIDYRSSIITDIPHLATNIRPEDRDEIWAALGETPRQALMRGYLHSTECFTVHDEGKPVCMFGYKVFEKGLYGSVWMLASTDLSSHKWRFLRRSEECLSRMHGACPLLFNVVDQRNDLHIKWLRWLGFRFIRIIQNHGKQGLPFVEFARLNHGT